MYMVIFRYLSEKNHPHIYPPMTFAQVGKKLYLCIVRSDHLIKTINSKY